MKKIIKVFLILVGCICLGGCGTKSVVSDLSSIRYLDDSTQSNVAYNLFNVAKQVKSAAFKGSVVIKNSNYYFSGEIIFGEHYDDSLLHIKYGENDLYVKNKDVYVGYFYKGVNFVVKDTVDNFAIETCNLLNDKGIKCEEDAVLDVVKNKNLMDLDFNEISSYISKSEKGYTFNYKEVKVELSDKYLPKEASYSKEDFSINILVEYDPVKISVPLMYEVFNVNIGIVKEYLNIEELISFIK